jgi:predicted enzyme related to lactoylglutathione lyase
MNRFCRFELRTTDAVAARAFYAHPDVLGAHPPVIWPLHAQALARGARPHWVGHLGVEDVPATAAAFQARGATALGPAPPTREGGAAVVLRDPGGAILALSTPPAAPPAPQAVWCALNTSDAARAAANYAELFGWRLTERGALGAAGTLQHFSWGDDGVSAGAIADLAGRPEVHPHWLFFFEVESLEAAVGAVRSNGGVALEPFELPSGRRACVCDDAQGAAFAVCARR